MDFFPALLILINALALTAVAIQNYRGSGTLELMKGFSNYFFSYIIALALAFLLAFALPASAKTSGGGELAKGNPALGATGGLCLPLAIPLLIAFAYIFTRVPGNEGRLAHVLFALLLLQQLWYAFDAASPRKAMLWLAILYAVGFFAILFAGAALAGGLLRRAFPGAERRHDEWVRTALSDPNFGANDAIARMIKTNMQSSGQMPPAGPNETQIINNPRTRPLFSWKPSDAAGALVLFSIWNVLMYALPVMI
ncbi:MAG: hypothetical protein WCY41_03425 [Candidatus Micrarchaeia archaeon]